LSSKAGEESINSCVMGSCVMGATKKH